MTKKQKIKKWFKDHFNKSNILNWVFVGLIVVIVILCIYFENKDKKQMQTKQADINIVDDSTDLLKNGVTLYNSGLDFMNLEENVSYIQRSYFVVNEPSPNNNNYYNVIMNYYFITFEIDDLINALTLYYGSNIPDMLYFNFNSALWYNNNYSSYWASSYTFDAIYGLHNDIDVILQYGSSLSFDIPLYSAYMQSNDYIGFTFSVPFDYTYYKNYRSQMFDIAFPQMDRVDVGASSSSYNSHYFTFDYNDNEYAFFIDDKSFDNNNYESLYNDLSNRFADLQSQYNNLNSDYNQLETNFNNVESNYNTLYNNYNTLNTEKESLEYQLDNAITQQDVKYNVGYQVGLNEGANQDLATNGFTALLNAIFSYPINFISSVFNFEFMGINVASILLFLVSVGIVLFVVKRLWK